MEMRLLLPTQLQMKEAIDQMTLAQERLSHHTITSVRYKLEAVKRTHAESDLSHWHAANIRAHRNKTDS
jgi:hypothetical protein